MKNKIISFFYLGLILVLTSACQTETTKTITPPTASPTVATTSTALLTATVLPTMPNNLQLDVAFQNYQTGQELGLASDYTIPVQAIFLKDKKNEDLVALTPYHLVSGAQKITVTVNEQLFEGKIIKGDECQDLALLAFPALAAQFSPVSMTIDEHAIFPSDHLFIAGEEYTLPTPPDFPNYERLGWNRWQAIDRSYQLLFPAANLERGQAVWNQQTELVGMVTDFTETGLTVTPSQEIKDFLQKANKNTLDLGINGEIFHTYDENVSPLSGLFVRAVQPTSAAAQTGLQAGDIVTAINQSPVTYGTSKNDYCQLLREGYQNGNLTLTVARPAWGQAEMTIFQGKLGQKLTKQETYPLTPRSLLNPGSSTPCRAWESVTLADVGQTMCVFGTVNHLETEFTKIGRALKFFHRGDQSGLILVYYAKDGYFGDFIGDCINVTGTVRQLGRSPALAFSFYTPVGRCQKLSHQE